MPPFSYWLYHILPRGPPRGLFGNGHLRKSEKSNNELSWIPLPIDNHGGGVANENFVGGHNFGHPARAFPAFPLGIIRVQGTVKI